MLIRYFALVYGVVFLLVGIAGFIPGLLTPYDAAQPDLVVEAGAGNLFGLFPVNVVHNLTHLAFGVWGILAYKSIPGSRSYARVVAVVYALFVVMGIIPLLNTTFGLVPLHGHDIWLHILLAGVAAYFGWAAPAEKAEPAEPTP